MAPSFETISAIRYGFGFRPGFAAPRNVDVLLASDPQASINAPSAGDRLKLSRSYRLANRKERETGVASEETAQYQREIRRIVMTDFAASVTRAFETHAGFEERLFRFWADHFTMSGKNLALLLQAGVLPEEALRPHVMGRFADMLFAAVTHPGMLMYLDQIASFGPNSQAGLRRGKGLNENLAREVLELHTLGVGATYSQADVTELAELFTGLSIDVDGLRFRPAMAEPGPETILGKRYGAEPNLATIRSALEDIAALPATAHHIAEKLVRHFVSDEPDMALVAHLAEVYLAQDGALRPVYRALVEHPDGQVPLGGKVKQPFEFAISCMRALDLSPQILIGTDPRRGRARLYRPLQEMGQQPLRPGGPDGWPEDAGYWITPAGLAARIDWVSGLAYRYGQDLDPRAFLSESLRDAAGGVLRAAVAGSEAKWEGVALVLASPEFNRR